MKRLGALVAALLVLLVPVLASAQVCPDLPRPDFVIDEVYFDGEGSGWIELANVGPLPQLLGNYYLTDAASYARLPSTGDGDALEDGSFLVRLPELQVRPGVRAVVRFGAVAPPATGTDIAFPTAEPAPELPDATAEDLFPSVSAPLAPETGGRLVLFYWDGTCDLVVDADIVVWGDAAFPGKNGLFVDGPDADDTPTFYGPDALTGTPAAEFRAPFALARTRGEIAETRVASANGLGGHDETTEDLALTFAPTGTPTPGAVNQLAFEVAGVVVDTDGTGVDGARLSVASLGITAESDLTGAFSLGPVRVGTHRVDAEAGARAGSADFDVVDGALALTIALTERGVAAGRVDLPGLGAPALAGTRVSTDGAETTTDGDGEFRLEGLPDGLVTLAFSRAGYRASTVETIADGRRIVLELTPDESAALTLTLDGSRRAIPSGARVELVGPQETRVATTDAPAPTALRFEDLTPGEWAVALSTATVSVRVPVRIASGENEAAIALPPPVADRGTSVSCQIAPLARGGRVPCGSGLGACLAFLGGLAIARRRRSLYS